MLSTHTWKRLVQYNWLIWLLVRTGVASVGRCAVSVEGKARLLLLKWHLSGHLGGSTTNCDGHTFIFCGGVGTGGRCKSFAASYSEVYNEPDAIEYNSTERLYLIGYFYSACQADASNTQIVCSTLFVVYNLPLLTQTQLKLSISIIFTKYISTQYIWLILYGNYRGWYNI